ncbi:MAG TPA: FAD-dependent oxidoreductase [Bacteroidia bacterium]|nr:FAD-dependent oxidoreductase [Bacteroidia bacterium]
MKKTDYIIAGHGIAGSVLALTLLDRGKKVLVIDKPSISASSKIAAGIYNPFNFRWMVNTWRSREIAPFSAGFYTKAESTLQAKFHFPRSILKILISEKDRRNWESACEEKRNLFADPELFQNDFDGKIAAPFGIGRARGGGNIDTGVFLPAVREMLRQKDALLEEKFQGEKLAVDPGGVIYDSRISASMLINCCGYAALRDKYFDSLPLHPVKGQVLQVRIPGLHSEAILNRGVYLLPLSGEEFICGATYEQGIADEDCTEEAREDLISKLKKFVTAEIKVVRQFAGIRPAVIDRRPIAGRHPEFPQLAVLNGFGSKAVLLAPWLADKLVEHLENGAALPAEVDVARFSNAQ